MQDFAGKVAVVTGGASGIGLGMATRFAAEGMRLVLADIEEEVLEAAAAGLRENGAEVLTVQTDCGDAASMDNLAEQTLGHYGSVHVVCNNAGVGGRGRMWDLSVNDWEFVLPGEPVGGDPRGARVRPAPDRAGRGAHRQHGLDGGARVGRRGGGVQREQARGSSRSRRRCMGSYRTRARTSAYRCSARASSGRTCATRSGTVPATCATSTRRRWRARTENTPGFSETVRLRALSPEWAAECVLEGIKANRFYILTHEDHEGQIARRHDAIQNDGTPADRPLDRLRRRTEGAGVGAPTTPPLRGRRAWQLQSAHWPPGSVPGVHRCGVPLR